MNPDTVFSYRCHNCGGTDFKKDQEHSPWTLHKLHISGTRCPKCLSDNIFLSDIQSWDMGRLWECPKCHYDDEQNRFIQNIPVRHERDI